MSQRTTNENLMLDFNWIEKGLSKSASNYTNVISFETGDLIRYKQLLGYLAHSTGFANNDIFIYDRWNGMGKLDRETGKVVAVAEGVGGRYRADGGSEEGNVLDLVQALRNMDKVMKRQKAAFIIRNPEGTGELERGASGLEELNHAVRSWATDSEIMYRKSVVIIISSAITRVLDTHTMRFTSLIRPDKASETERLVRIRDLARGVNLDISAIEGSLVIATAGLNLHQMEGVLLETYNTVNRFDLEMIKDLKSALITQSDNLTEIEEPEGGFENIGGYNAVKEFVRRYVIDVLKNPARAVRLALPLPRGILLFGPPGTGKTLFARALARETMLPFINLKTENLYSKWLGESGERFRDAMHTAEQMSPAIVFVDEIDRFGKRTGGGSDGASEETHRVFSQVLEWLGQEKRKAVIVGTTNVPEHLDEAFIRTGRFDYKIPILYPGSEARKQILEIHLGLAGNMPGPEMDEAKIKHTISEIVERTHNYSGVELKELVSRAKRRALKNGRDYLIGEDLVRAANAFKIDSGKRESIRQRYIELAEEFTDDSEFLEEIERDR